MTIDFSWSIDQWIDVINRFLQIIKDFFAGIGIQLFADAEKTDAAETDAIR